MPVDINTVVDRMLDRYSICKTRDRGLKAVNACNTQLTAMKLTDEEWRKVNKGYNDEYTLIEDLHTLNELIQPVQKLFISRVTEGYSWFRAPTNALDSPDVNTITSLHTLRYILVSILYDEPQATK